MNIDPREVTVYSLNNLNYFSSAENSVKHLKFKRCSTHLSVFELGNAKSRDGLIKLKISKTSGDILQKYASLHLMPAFALDLTS